MKRDRSRALTGGLVRAGLTMTGLGLSACGSRPTACVGCDRTVVVSATGEPASVMPPLVNETVGRDISDLIYQRLADLAPGAAPADTAAYRPRLAARWERLDSLTWRFHLRPGATWQDGRPVTTEDVRFSFDAFGDPVLDAPARPYLAGRIAVEVEDAATVRLRFAEASPEQLYDATYHVRVIPAHIWAPIPRATWAADTSLGRVVGTGPYRLTRWKRGEFLVLVADSAAPAPARPPISRVVWRFAADAEAALNLVLGGEADLLESVGSPRQARRFDGDPAIELRAYPSATYGFLAFKVADSAGRPHPLFGERAVRRGLALAVDRATLAHALLGKAARPPSGPMSQLLWIQSDRIATLPYDTAAAAQSLDAAGWTRPSGAAARRRRGRALAFDILVPNTSNTRRQAAVMLQETWRRMGAEVSVTAVDGPIFHERIRSGRFDAYIGAYLDEPSARGLADQWTRRGWGMLNFGHYANPAFDSLFERAGRTGDLAVARELYREAMDTINADAAGVFLYAPSNIAAIRRELVGVELDPYSWLSGLPTWEVALGRAARLASSR